MVRRSASTTSKPCNFRKYGSPRENLYQAHCIHSKNNSYLVKHPHSCADVISDYVFKWILYVFVSNFI